MPTPDQIKPFLLHDDPDVRKHAARYFSDSWSEDADLLPLVLDSCERHGVEENHSILYDAHRFTVAEDSLDRLLALLASVKDASAIDHLNRIVIQAPVEIVRDRQEAIERNPNIRPATLLRIQRRRDLFDWSGERLWEELQDVARRADDEEDGGKIDRRHAAEFVDALGRHDVPDAGTICRLLGELEPDVGWLEIFLVDLAGRRRLREAVPILVDKLHLDGDFVLESASDALARIGDPEAVALIRREFPDATYDYRLYATGVLGKIKHPDSEAAILALLETETDAGVRMWLCSSLCDLISDQSLDAVLKEIRSGDDMALRDLTTPALAVAAMLGAGPSPEIEALERERRRRRRAEHRGAFETACRRTPDPS